MAKCACVHACARVCSCVHASAFAEEREETKGGREGGIACTARFICVIKSCAQFGMHFAPAGPRGEESQGAVHAACYPPVRETCQLKERVSIRDPMCVCVCRRPDLTLSSWSPATTPAQRLHPRPEVSSAVHTPVHMLHPQHTRNSPLQHESASRLTKRQRGDGSRAPGAPGRGAPSYRGRSGRQGDAEAGDRSEAFEIIEDRWGSECCAGCALSVQVSGCLLARLNCPAVWRLG